MAVIRESDVSATTRDEHDALLRVQRLLVAAEGGERLVLRGGDDTDGAEVTVPAALVRILLDAAQALATKHSATFVVTSRELTTQQAAELLHVSRPYLVEHLLATGEIPFSMTGTHRRLALEDVLSYQERRDAERRGHLDALAQMSQEMGLDHA